MKLPCAALAGALAVVTAMPAVRAQDPPPPTSTPAAPAPGGDDLPPEYRPVTPEPAPDSKKLRTTTGEEEDDDEVQITRRDEVQWGIGARLRYVTVPQFMINAFVDHSTPVRAYSVAGEVVRKKGNFNIVLSLEYARLSPEDGLWQENGEDPGMENMYPDYLDFDDVALLSADVSFLWHVPITSAISFRSGAGIGLGAVLGGYTQQDTRCNSQTQLDDLDDPNACTRVGLIEDGDLPPVVPVLNLLLGVRFKVVDQVSLQIEGGWRFPSFFVGGGLGYFF